MKPLTEQQAAVADLAGRGYSAKSIARAIGRTQSQVADQMSLIRKKGVHVEYLSPKEERERLNIDEAHRIAESYH